MFERIKNLELIVSYFIKRENSSKVIKSNI